MTAQLSEPGRPQPDQEGPERIWARTRRGIDGRSWSLRRRLGLAFVVAGIVLAVGFLLGGLALNSMISAVNLQVDRLDPAARQSTYLLASLLNEETGVRGFVITDRPSFLEPYSQGLAHSAAYERMLSRQFRPYPTLLRELRTVVYQAAKWRSHYAEPAIATTMRHARVGVALETIGENEFDRLRGDIGTLNSRILSERANALRRLRGATTAVIVVAITGAIALIGAAFAAWAAMIAWIVRPLAELGGQAQVVASGGIDHRLKVRGPQEVMELAADVEAMRRQLLSSMGNLTSKASELERSNRELEQFAYVASHDLQEPLRKVASFCQMLESRYASQVADGDFTHHVDPGGPQEVRTVGLGVNRMRERILAELSAVRAAHTSLEAAHASLEARTEDLQRSNAELEQFAYVASHDLQEPLRKVASFCQLLQRRYAGRLDEKADQYIELAVDGAKRMQQLINDLLAFSRVGRTAQRREEVSCSVLLAQAWANLGPAARASHATIEAGHLPVVLGETSLLTAVFQNLLSNALKFASDQAPRVSVSARRDEGNWIFSFADNGIGIPAEYAERIFVIFQRLHDRSAYPGTGIGLAMCRKIIEYHGGRIWLDTAVTSGARFCFTLPVRPEDADTDD